MMAPFYNYGFFGHDFSLVIAILIGFGFGFFLERGGLGNANKLAAQFYLKDFTVLKVMFTAIITAMLGLNLLHSFGVLDLGRVYLNPTYLMPQLLAGLLFGIGFVMGGLCPGTCLVATATGKLDGLATLAGILCGIFVFGESFSNFTVFLYSTSYGQITMAGILDMAPALMVAFITAVAALFFVVINRYESRIRKEDADKKERNNRVHKILLYAALSSVLCIVAAGVLIEKESFTDEAESTAYSGDKISATDLGERMMKKKENFALVDLRSRRQYNVYHIPGAVSISDDPSFAGNEVLVIYSQFGNVEPELISKLKVDSEKKIYILDGGIHNWIQSVLFPDLTLSNTEEASSIYRRKIMSTYFGGYPRTGNIKQSSVAAQYKREGC